LVDAELDASLDDGVDVDEALLDGALVDGDMVELLELDDGVVDELDDVSVDGVVVVVELELVDGAAGTTVVVLELDVAGGVPEGTGTVVVVRSVSFWQPAAARAAAMARTAQGFGFIGESSGSDKGTGRCVNGISRIGAIGRAGDHVVPPR
jgi:hypothetical protein